MSRFTSNGSFVFNLDFMIRFILILLASISILRCTEQSYTPKPRAYPRVLYPEKTYKKFQESYCGFEFEVPEYAQITQDTSFFDEKPSHPCWFNIYFPDFDASIYCSYAPISDNTPIDQLKSDAFRMTDWHNKKASYIQESPFAKPNDVKGVLFTVEGPVASQTQFFITDSLEQRHFMRGALYFNTQARPDSLAPVHDFLMKDIMKMLETFRWK
jgi:gliding motility-associated lipoprotein GldD